MLANFSISNIGTLLHQLEEDQQILLNASHEQATYALDESQHTR